jgi:hypothetical protein
VVDFQTSLEGMEGKLPSGTGILIPAFTINLTLSKLRWFVGSVTES